jgi:hypothetical protein
MRIGCFPTVHLRLRRFRPSFAPKHRKFHSPAFPRWPALLVADTGIDSEDGEGGLRRCTMLEGARAQLTLVRRACHTASCEARG